MATECYSQLGFGFQPKLVVDFAGGTLTTDAGLLLVREFDEQLRPQRGRRQPDHRQRATRATSRTTSTRSSASGCIRSPRGTRTSTMPTGSGTIPTFQVVAADGRTTLGSQPTLSRLENAIEWPAIQRLARTGVDWFCAYAYGPDEHPADLVLDLDSTDDPTHGTQQLALFHGWYDQHMYHPLVWFEGRTGLLLRTRLASRPRSRVRPGWSTSSGTCCRRCAAGFRTRRSSCARDAGMATPAVEAKLEAEGIRYVLGIGTNRVFKARVAPLVAQAQARYERTRAARPHPHQLSASREVVAASRGGSSSRSMSPPRASMSASWSPIAAAAPPISSRGTTTAARRRIGSRNSSSTSTPIASAVIASAPTPFRLQLHSLALLLLAYFRRAVLAGTRLASATIGTIRLHLLKVAGRVVRSVRRLWFHLASHWPGQPLFTQLSSRARPRASITTSHATYSSTARRRRPEVSSRGRLADRSATPTALIAG